MNKEVVFSGDELELLQKFGESAARVVDYLVQEGVKEVCIMGLSGVVAEDFMSEVAERRGVDFNFSVLNPHNLVYALGYHLQIPFEDKHKGNASWRNYSDYHRKVQSVLAEGLGDKVALLEPIRLLLEQSFPQMISAIRKGDSILIMDEIVASGSTLDIVVNLLKLFYPQANIKRGAIWRDSAERYQQYDPQLDICGGTGPDFLSKARLGSIWTGRTDMQFPDGSLGTAYYDDVAIAQCVEDCRGGIDLSVVDLTNSPADLMVGYVPIGEILTRRRKVRQVISDIVDRL